MKIATNPHSLLAQRYLKNNVADEEAASLKLSSGDRINNSATDPSGLAISEGMKAKSRSLSMARRNANDGISLIQTTESSLGLIHDLTGRLRELAMQAANDTLTDQERWISNKEYSAVKTEISRVVDSTQFNGRKVLSQGDNGVYDIQIGFRSKAKTDYITYDMNKVLQGLDLLGIDHTNVMNKEMSRQSLSELDRAIEKVSSGRADLGALSNRMLSSIANLDVSTEETESAKSRIRDTDLALVTSDRLSAQIKKNATIALLGHVNNVNKNVIKLVE